MLDLVSLGEDKYLIHLRGHEFRSGTTLIESPTLIVRMLTYDELKNLDKFLPADKKTSSSSWVMSATLEENIWGLCVLTIVGHEKLKLDLIGVEAGFISTVAGLIYKKSLDHINRTEAYIQIYAENATLFDQIKLLVARNYSMSYKEVNNLPIDVLCKKYAVIHRTLPNESINFEKEEEQPADDE